MPYWICHECSGKTLGLGLGLLEINVASGFVGYHNIYIYIYIGITTSVKVELWSLKVGLSYLHP